MTDQHKELSGQNKEIIGRVNTIEKTVEAIDFSIQGNPARGMAGMVQHLEELKESSLNHHERISALEQELPKAKQNNKVMFGMGAGAGAAAAAAATSIKVGGWAAFKSGVVAFFKMFFG